MQSCLNIIDNYKMAQFFRNSVIGNYSAMQSRQKQYFVTNYLTVRERVYLEYFCPRGN